MAEPHDVSGIDFWGQDLLSVALGESGLNLEEAATTDFTSGSTAPVALSGIGNNYLNDFRFQSNGQQPVQQIPTTGELISDNSLDLILDDMNDLFNEYNQFLAPQESRFSTVTSSVSQQMFQPPFYQPNKTNLESIFSDSLNVSSSPGAPNIPAQSSSALFSTFSASNLTTTTKTLLGLPTGSGSPNGSAGANQELKKELSRKDVSRLWSNDDVSLNHVSEKIQSEEKQEENEEEEEEEEFGHTDTYAEYVPSKLKYGLKHPDPVIETSSLSSVQPPDIWYRLQLPEEVVHRSLLSALQLEAVVYACQQHETFLADGSRAGFLIGDGAGVGKGRTVAGIIYENYLCGRKRALWLSVSNDLKFDAVRDLRDIGCHVHVHSLNKFKYEAKITSKTNGSVKKGVVFATYSSLIGESQGTGKYCTRLNQLLHWCGSNFEGVIILDECHKAKNLVPAGSSKPTKTGLTVLMLQKKLPKARVVYCSATGASEPKNMAYMSRLGIWGPGTPFREFMDFIQAVERRGVGAMEIVAMDMKLRGMYMARQLSFAGVSFDIQDVKLSKEFTEMYDTAVKLWVEAREKFEKAVNLMEADNRMKKTMWGQFWSAHQRFFKYLCIASKVQNAVKIAKRSIESGKCVVIGLQSTGEARTLEQLEEAGGELNDFVSTAKGVLGTLIEKHFPAPDKKKLTDLFGFDADSDNSDMRSDRSSPVPALARKRKKAVRKPAVKKVKSEVHRLFNMNNSSSSDDNSREGAADGVNGLDKKSDTSDSEASADDDEDDFNPFQGGSDSEEDPWLNRKVKKNKVKSEESDRQTAVNPSYNSALAAAGFNVGELSWTKAKSPSKLLNGLNITKRPSTPSQMNTAPTINNATIDLNLHHSASAPVLTSLLTSSGMQSSTGLAPSDQCRAMKRELLEKLAELGPKLPPNTLDELIDELGGPQCVSEMTGRKGRVVSRIDGSVSYESRSKEDVPLEMLNIEEKKRFMEGEKKVAVISEAASSGISLQADRRVKNQCRRVHITLELPWSADKAIQQFGRTHRSNQVSAPEYLFLISELAGEHRFASIVAKRLESLGALTHGDRRATESRDLSRYNVDNKYGRTALEATLKSVIGSTKPLVPPPADYCGNFFQAVRSALVGVGLIQKAENGTHSMPDKDLSNMSRFLNRILGIEVELQNRLFGYFMDTLAAVIQQAKNSGRWDEGILDLGSHGEEVNELSVQTFVGSATSGTSTTELHTVSVERGMSWEQAQQLAAECTNPDDGFYLSHQSRSNKKTAIFVQTTTRGKKKKGCNIFRPHTGHNLKQELIDDLKKRYRKVSALEAEMPWRYQYEACLELCTHAYWKGNCKKVALGLTCEVGLRRRTFHILSGSVLSVWSKVESVLAGQSGSNSKIQIIRCKKSDGNKIVGCLIPNNCVPALARKLTPEPSEDVGNGGNSAVICIQ